MNSEPAQQLRHHRQHTVRQLASGAVLIHDHVVDDLGASALLAKDPSSHNVERLLGLGATLAAQIDGLAVVDTIDAKIEQLQQAIGAAGGQLDAQMKASVQALSSQLGDHLRHVEHVLTVDHLDAPAGQLASHLGTRLDRVAGDVCRRLTSDHHAPLRSVERELHTIRSDINALRDRVVEHKAQAEMLSVSPKKGLVFEAAVEDELLRVAKIVGDTIVRIGTSPEPTSGSQAGDFLARLSLIETSGVEVRIALEAKNTKMSLPALRKEMERVRLNRGAIATIAVLANAEHAPRCLSPIGEITPIDFACVFNPDDPTSLHLVYRFARLVALSNVRAAHADGPTLSSVTEALTAIRSRMGQIRTIKTNLTRMERGVAKTTASVKQELDRMHTDVLDAIAGFETTDRAATRPDADMSDRGSEEL